MNYAIVPGRISRMPAYYQGRPSSIYTERFGTRTGRHDRFNT